MRPVKPILAGLVLLLVVAQAHAESRTVLVQVKQDKDKKARVTIHSDEKKEQKSAVSVDEAVKVIGEMKGWGSTVGVYVTSDRGGPRADLKKLLGAIHDNLWLDLKYFGREVPKVVGDHFLKAAKDLHFHRGVPASELKIELAAAAKATRPHKAIYLPVKVANLSSAEIRTTLAHEWRGGKVPGTCLYASVAPAQETKDPALVPAYLAGEADPYDFEAITLAAGKSKELLLRMDWPGTGSGPAPPFMNSAGIYKVQVLLVFEISGKLQYVMSEPTTVEVPGLKPIGPKPEPWAGEPVTAAKSVRGGKLSTFKRLPKAADATLLPPQVAGEPDHR